MTLKLAAIALLSLSAAVGLPACANSRARRFEPATETAQMDHGGMGQMDGGMMDHGMMDLGPADESFGPALYRRHDHAPPGRGGHGRGMPKQNSTRPEIQTSG